MAIEFFNSVSENLYSKLIDCKDFDNLIDICVEHINEFFSTIKGIEGSQSCNLETQSISLTFEHLEKYLKENLRRSKRLVRKELILIFEKYAVGFGDCIFLIKKKIFSNVITYFR